MMIKSPRIMGILNITPDSFADGGRYLEPRAAIEHALTMINEGADILDLGGESTRPGSSGVSATEQLRRVIPILKNLRERIQPDFPLSIDTTSAQVAAAALDAGANWINDTSAGQDDPRMFALAAERGVPLVLMHRQGRPENMQINPSYQDVVREVSQELSKRVELALKTGVRAEQILLDPGIGFGKQIEHNLFLLARLNELINLGFPILIGASRKSFLGILCKETAPSALLAATCAITALCVLAGVSILRVHDVAANRQVATVAWALRCHQAP